MNLQTRGTFRVGLSHEMRGPIAEALDLTPLEHSPHIDWDFLPEHGREIPWRCLTGFDALFLHSARVTAETLSGPSLPQLVALFGVGLDGIDVDACTRNGVLVTISPDGVRRPMALGVLAFLLALSQNIVARDRWAREPLWPNRFTFVSAGLTDKTLGFIGFGNIATEVRQLLKPFCVHVRAYGPRLTQVAANLADVERTDLETLLRTSDYVCVTCRLTEETYHLLDERRLRLMKPTAFLINVARGAIIEEQALIDALTSGRLAGAALDVLEEEPLRAGNPLAALDNVILAPHSVGYNEELYAGCGRSACTSILAVAEGRIPEHAVNPAAYGVASRRASKIT
jgi:phosphoglycerate dehydrogenase-like enzyme